jgi:hypothetical protein
MTDAKLSDLQCWILTRAAQSPDASTSYKPRDLIAARVLHEFYGVPLKQGRTDIRWAEINFDLTRIDRRKYDAAKSATSKAFARLSARGLAVQFQGGTLKLTEAGTVAASGLQGINMTLT